MYRFITFAGDTFFEIEMYLLADGIIVLVKQRWLSRCFYSCRPVHPRLVPLQNGYTTEVEEQINRGELLLCTVLYNNQFILKYCLVTLHFMNVISQVSSLFKHEVDTPTNRLHKEEKGYFVIGYL